MRGRRKEHYCQHTPYDFSSAEATPGDPPEVQCRSPWGSHAPHAWVDRMGGGGWVLLACGRKMKCARPGAILRAAVEHPRRVSSVFFLEFPRLRATAADRRSRGWSTYCASGGGAPTNPREGLPAGRPRCCALWATERRVASEKCLAVIQHVAEAGVTRWFGRETGNYQCERWRRLQKAATILLGPPSRVKKVQLQLNWARRQGWLLVRGRGLGSPVAFGYLGPRRVSARCAIVDADVLNLPRTLPKSAKITAYAPPYGVSLKA